MAFLPTALATLERSAIFVAELAVHLESQGVESLSRRPELTDRNPAPAEVLVVLPCSQERPQQVFISSGGFAVGRGAAVSAGLIVVFSAASI